MFCFFSQKILLKESNNCPILVLGNKMDKSDAMSECDVRERLGLIGIATGKQVCFVC